MSNTKIQRSLAGGLSVLTASSVIALTAIPPTPLVDLAALIVVGSSTNPSGAGIENFYGGKYIPPDGDIVYVDFATGPAGIAQALQDNSGEDNVVLTSGWGASNASQVLVGDPANPDVSGALWVLDNNLNIPNGGFATRYPGFSRLVSIDPTPTPTDIDAIVIEVRYEYDINSDAPAYVLNPFAMANTLVAYLYRRLNQDELELPVDANGNPTCSSPCTLADGTVVHISQVNNVTYVTYDSAGLPLLRPLRDFVPVLGNPLADLAEPALTALVNYGYPDNDPLGDPNVLRPARLVPTAQETTTFVNNFATGVQQGLSTLGGGSTTSTTPTTPTTSATNAETSSGATTSTPKTAPLADKPKPLTNVVKNSPMFKPRVTPGDTKQSGTQATDPLGALADTVKNALSGGSKEPTEGENPTATGDSEPATAGAGS